jgi:LacI family transcriptional regulator
VSGLQTQCAVRMLAGDWVKAKAHLLKPLGIVTRQSTDSFAIDDEDLVRAAQYIRSHACSGIQVEDILGVVPLTRRVLEARFKKHFWHTPHEAILRVRLRRAQELLEETDLPLATIAERAGFLHPEYFSVAFKRVNQMTPSEYRRRLKAGK